MKKNKYNPSGHPVYTKGSGIKKGSFLKAIESYHKKLSINIKNKRKVK